MSEEPVIHDSTGNVFEDMGLPDAEGELAKALLMRIVQQEIRRRGLTQVQAACVLGVRQPDVSDLVRGRLSRFSFERLIRFLNALDLEVLIQVGPRGDARAGVTVERTDSSPARREEVAAGQSS